MTISIGDWVSRPGDRDRWHYVDSLVAEDVMTKCGRRMALKHPKGELEQGLSWPEYRPADACRVCMRIKERGE